MAQRKKFGRSLSLRTVRISFLLGVIVLVGGLAFIFQSFLGARILPLGSLDSHWCPTPIKSTQDFGPMTFTATDESLLAAKNTLIKQANAGLHATCTAQLQANVTCPLAQQDDAVCAAADEPHCSSLIQHEALTQQQLPDGRWTVTGQFTSSCTCSLRCLPQQMETGSV